MLFLVRLSFIFLEILSFPSSMMNFLNLKAGINLRINLEKKSELASSL
jgi:hypothetical protein